MEKKFLDRIENLGMEYYFADSDQIAFNNDSGSLTFNMMTNTFTITEFTMYCDSSSARIEMDNMFNMVKSVMMADKNPYLFEMLYENEDAKFEFINIMDPIKEQELLRCLNNIESLYEGNNNLLYLPLLNDQIGMIYYFSNLKTVFGFNPDKLEICLMEFFKNEKPNFSIPIPEDALLAKHILDSLKEKLKITIDALLSEASIVEVQDNNPYFTLTYKTTDISVGIYNVRLEGNGKSSFVLSLSVFGKEYEEQRFEFDLISKELMNYDELKNYINNQRLQGIFSY